MPTIISIHGTYASKPTEEGDEWWQRGSFFERHLRECVETEGGTLSFQPLRWDGENKESSRREAAKELVERCKALERSGERYFLIGHSHGGSIISNALLVANEALGAAVDAEAQLRPLASASAASRKAPAARSRRWHAAPRAVR